MKNKFDGYYFKHQKGGKTVSFIPGISADGAFIQVITDKQSYNFNFPKAEMKDIIKIGCCTFSKNGINIELPDIRGGVEYKDITPLKSDIMGVFKFFPMECRHGVISMRHRLTGKLLIEGETIDLNGGVGYIEKDSGVSFPKNYMWIQCNNFDDDTSVMVSVAEIPFMGFTFQGCICAIVHDKKEYRLATYFGVQIKLRNNCVILIQGKYRLEIEYENKEIGHPLTSPISGKMSGIIHENNSAQAVFRFFIEDELVFDKFSKHVSFERFNM